MEQLQKRNFNFKVEKVPNSQIRLELEKLDAVVFVSTGKPGEATVTLEGRENLLDDIGITCKSNVVRVIGNSNSNGRNVSFKLNGVNDVKDVTVVKGAEIPILNITVPEKTDLYVHGGKLTTADGLGGCIFATLYGTSKLFVSKTSRMNITCRQQSHCYIEGAAGSLKVSTSDQSQIEVTGNLSYVQSLSRDQSRIFVAQKSSTSDHSGIEPIIDNIIASTYDKSEIRVRGNLGDINACSYSQSCIIVGREDAKSIRGYIKASSYGNSEIHIIGNVSGDIQADVWGAGQILYHRNQ